MSALAFARTASISISSYGSVRCTVAFGTIGAIGVTGEFGTFGAFGAIVVMHFSVQLAAASNEGRAAISEQTLHCKPQRKPAYNLFGFTIKAQR